MSEDCQARSGAVVQDKTAFMVRREHRLLSLIFILALFGVWELIVRLGLVSPLFLPAPSAILITGYKMALSGEIFRHIGASLWRIFWGFSCAAVIGTLVGILLGFFSVAESIGNPIIASTYPIPKIAILPLLILWLGIGEYSKIAVIGLGVFFPMVINVYTGVRNADPVLIKAAVSLGSSRRRIILKVILPSALPMIFAGLKLGIGIALLLVVAAEMIAADAGIGFMILTSADLMQTTKLMFGISILSMLGLIFSWLIDRLERLCIPWKE
ncbi:MAG: ABC transporter permease [Deltaproteobacteria bacterium]|nr:ABC transporter permease [Deltaproteobacteria bacterium]MBW2048840.1 ABC transporter permease [Deltaproteobacteria bacterium]MBW2111600.1 ABC transporter permease [Deltaproteobacteria bacterium]MBW2353580.1 ABC transporter permease [Deltaproteobacteria bacterium]HDZ90568.1 ABC transporter permease [Deltaproteobacteria bacterium]